MTRYAATHQSTQMHSLNHARGAVPRSISGADAPVLPLTDTKVSWTLAEGRRIFMGWRRPRRHLNGMRGHMTTQRQVERELERQTAHLDELFELSPDAVVLTAISPTRTIRVNMEFTRIFGYTSEETVGR